MIIGLLKDSAPERRVALLPENVEYLISLKVEVFVQKGAGDGAFISDESYSNAGAKILTREEVMSDADVLQGLGQ